MELFFDSYFSLPIFSHMISIIIWNVALSGINKYTFSWEARPKNNFINKNKKANFIFLSCVFTMIIKNASFSISLGTPSVSELHVPHQMTRSLQSWNRIQDDSSRQTEEVDGETHVVKSLKLSLTVHWAFLTRLMHLETSSWRFEAEINIFFKEGHVYPVLLLNPREVEVATRFDTIGNWSQRRKDKYKITLVLSLKHNALHCTSITSMLMLLNLTTGLLMIVYSKLLD